MANNKKTKTTTRTSKTTTSKLEFSSRQAQALKLYRSGLTTKQAAKAMKIGVNSYTRLRRKALNKTTGGTKNRLTRQEFVTAYFRWVDGWTNEKIAKYLGTTEYAIGAAAGRVLEKFGLSKANRGRPTRADHAKLVEFFQNNKTQLFSRY